MGKDSVEGARRDNWLENFLLVIWGVCFTVPVILFLVMRWWFGSAMPEKISDWGVYGDFVGGLSNPFISAMTFLGLILTIMQNQKVLRLNEEELRITRKEIELTREANEQQAQEFRSQNEISLKQVEIQTITEAMLKITNLFNDMWGRPSPVEITRHRQEGPGYEVVNLGIEDAMNLYSRDGGLSEKNKERLEAHIVELVQLLGVHKSLLISLAEVSPNEAMVSAASLLVRGPVKLLTEHALLIKVTGEQEAQDLISFYEKYWQ